jgi:hypothetical protein
MRRRRPGRCLADLSFVTGSARFVVPLALLTTGAAAPAAIQHSTIVRTNSNHVLRAARSERWDTR